MGVEIWTRQEDPGVTVVRVVGEVDVRTAPALRTALDRAVEQGEGDLVLDLSQVGFVDSSGLGVILGRHRRMPPGRRLVLRSPRPHVRTLLELAGVTRLLPVEEGDSLHKEDPHAAS
jgi:stage II sporulation protein AA (anti-sigma F factor antagonist)